MTHPSHPDMLMARALGVCWHSPTSDRWPCTVLPPSYAEHAMLHGGLNDDGTDGWPAPEAAADHPLRLVAGTEVCSCGHLRGKHHDDRDCLDYSLGSQCPCEEFDDPALYS